MLETAYRNARERITAVAAALDEEQLQTTVPATPEWTVRQLISHLVGVAADVEAGRLDGVATDEWTARQVGERESRTLAELLAEWDDVGPVAESTLTDDQRFGPNLATDAICHEGDLREALGLGRVERGQWQPFLDVLMLFLRKQLQHNTSLLVSDETGQQWSCGSGEPATLLRTDGYELLRAGLSRRSRRQIAAWDWTPAPPSQMIDAFGVFGPRDDDQPTCG